MADLHPIHVVLDLETLGTDSDAAIMTIGACAIDISKPLDLPDAPDHYPNTFYARVSNHAKAPDLVGAINVDTVRWWLQQPANASIELCHGDAIPLGDALDKFTAWFADIINDTQSICVWGNGASFDNVILRSAYIRANRYAPTYVRDNTTPWPWWNDRDLRTALMFAPAGFTKAAPVVAHHALHDAVAQARNLHAVLHPLWLAQNTPAGKRLPASDHPAKACSAAFKWLQDEATKDGADPLAGIALDEWHALMTRP